ncbi:MAG: hypothetical protein MRK02_00705 [Candidatus Scalindua sp.]|nr:hypothetical protein [Candidatus Scalindua sp.]
MFKEKLLFLTIVRLVFLLVRVFCCTRSLPVTFNSMASLSVAQMLVHPGFPLKTCSNECFEAIKETEEKNVAGKRLIELGS